MKFYLDGDIYGNVLDNLEELDLQELPRSEVTQKIKSFANKAHKSDRADLVNI